MDPKERKRCCYLKGMMLFPEDEEEEEEDEGDAEPEKSNSFVQQKFTNAK